MSRQRKIKFYIILHFSKCCPTIGIGNAPLPKVIETLVGSS